MSSATQQKIVSQTIALAAVAQAISIVQAIAWRNQYSEADLKPLLLSLLRVNPPSAAAVYDGTFELSRGLRKIRIQLDAQSNEKDPEFVSLMINVLVLQKQLSNNKPLLDKLSEEIQNLCHHYQGNELKNDPDAFERFVRSASDVYRLTLSKLPNRIQVRGEPANLKNDFNQACIRAALLTAIRAAFMWRQYGGTRWHFLFKRKAILRTADTLIRRPLSAEDEV